MAESSIAGLLDGLRAIDLSTVVMGPYAAQIPGHVRVDVIKFESPFDTMRVGESRSLSKTALDLNVNCNKRSGALNLKSLAYVDAAVRNSGVVYAHGHSLRSESDWADHATYDKVVPGERTTEEVVRAAVALYTAVGRAPVVEHREIPTLVGNRLQNAAQRPGRLPRPAGRHRPRGLRYRRGPVARHPLVHGRAVRRRDLGGDPGGYRHVTEHIGTPMAQMVLGEPSQAPEDRERVVCAVEEAYASTPYADLAEGRDRKQLAVLSALEDVRPNRNTKEN
ncbi:CoA transferase [Streptomyces sp. NPDC059582]|uniref:CoA transferase n=1 Tax=Streptomyces sp. NPDC059582 TaxID=3346875 RepID=UPI00368C6623